MDFSEFKEVMERLLSLQPCKASNAPVKHTGISAIHIENGFHMM